MNVVIKSYSLNHIQATVADQNLNTDSFYGELVKENRWKLLEHLLVLSNPSILVMGDFN